MKLWLLKNVARFFGSQDFISHIKRVDDNLFKLEFKEKTFYLDMTKGSSEIFIAPSALMSVKKYNAPFDVMLSKLASRAKILACDTDGNNRILKMECLQAGTYKNTRFLIQFEFTGRYTNVILLDEDNRVLEALRHINSDKSFREVRINKYLEPLVQRDFDPEEKILEDKDLLVMLENIYSERMQKDLETKKQLVNAKISKKISKLYEILTSLPKEEELLKNAKILAKNASIVLANLDKIPNFSTEITLNDFDSKPIEISLPKESRTPQEGANMMFALSKKLIKKAKNTHLQVENLQSKIDFLNQEKNLIQNLKTFADIAILEPKKSSKINHCKYEVFFIEGIKISIGRNQAENQSLLQEARADDIWLHIKDVPSSHMIIHCGKNKVPQEVIFKAGEILVGLCYIQVGNFIVDYTKRKFVKILQGAQVHYAKEQTFHYKKPF